jgi:hypothetical protein
MSTGFWWGKLKERDRLDDLRVDAKVILKWILKKLDGMARTC